MDALRERQNNLASNASAILLPSEKGFTYLSDGTLSVTISLERLTQKGSSTEVAMSVGNLTSGVLQKCSVVAQVRPTKDGYFEAGTEQAISGDLLPGKFNERTILVPDTKVENISALQLSSLLCQRVRLYP